MLIIGVDYHPSFPQIAFLDQDTGECGERRPNHSDGAVTVLGETFSLLVATFQRPPSSFEAKNELFRVRKAMAEA
jgi:hypothetical protein